MSTSTERGKVWGRSAGAVVELLRTGALVEFADEHGRTVELLDVPYEDLIVRSPEPAERRAAG